MNRLLGWASVAILVGASIMFASLNSSHRVTLRLGFVTLLGVPLTVVVFGAVILGMVVMLSLIHI